MPVQPINATLVIVVVMDEVICGSGGGVGIARRRWRMTFSLELSRQMIISGSTLGPKGRFLPQAALGRCA